MLPTNKDKLSPVESDAFAEAYADMVLNPSWPWMRIEIIRSFKDPQATKQILKLIGFPMPDTPPPEWARDFADAVEKMDRESLIAVIKAACSEIPLTRGMADFVLTTDFAGSARKALLKTAQKFSARRGRKSKATRREYPKIAVLGNNLYPVCVKVVTELRSGTRYPVEHLLERLKPEFPDACTFLLAHLSRFQSILDDEGLRKRAKGIESFAHLLADGMAGADYELEPRTAIERAREGRRLLSQVRT